MANILVILAVTFWGLSFIATKITLDYLNPFELIAVRFLLAIPVLYIISRLKDIKMNLKRGDLPIFLISSLILGGHFVIQAFGLVYTSATNTAWLIATVPAFIAILSALFLKEKLTLKKILGIIVASAGVVLMVSRGDLGTIDWIKSTGDWIILGSCISWATYTIITRPVTQRYHPMNMIIFFMITPALILAGYVLYNSPFSRFTELPSHILILLLFLGIFCLGLAHWFWLEGLSRKGATEVGVFLYLEPIVTTIAAVSIISEDFSIFAALGALLILFGVYIVQKKIGVDRKLTKIADSTE